MDVPVEPDGEAMAALRRVILESLIAMNRIQVDARSAAIIMMLLQGGTWNISALANATDIDRKSVKTRIDRLSVLGHVRAEGEGVEITTKGREWAVNATQAFLDSAPRNVLHRGARLLSGHIAHPIYCSAETDG